MRLVALVACCVLAGQSMAQVRINELQCTRVEGSDGKDGNGDWVELYNAGTRSVHLDGHILSLGLRSERLGQGLVIAPGGFLVLWCGKEDAPDHIHLKLPREGGALLLVAPDGAQVLDVFRWPAMPPGVSLGRKVDGEKEWGFLGKPTPGSPNQGAVGRLLPGPQARVENGSLEWEAIPDAVIRYTTDGSAPGPGAQPFNGPMRFPAGTVVRARAFAPDAVPGPIAVCTVGLPDTAWSLVLAPEDLTGPNGVNDTLNGNHARKGRAWQRQAWLQRGGQVLPVGLAVAGSGSRSLPKRNFKLMVRDRFNGSGPVQLPDGAAWRDLLLRADATPGAFLRNLFMEEVARRSGGHVDVQPSRSVALHLNGGFQGLYRVMPAKGNEWLRSLNGLGPVEIVEGSAVLPVKGSAKEYIRAVGALHQGMPAGELEHLMDLQSLIELACLDLWTGRVDHEMNVRAWRPAAADGRWRWVLYDMDLWAPAGDLTVPRMCGSSVAESPFLPRLLAEPALRDRLLARLSALCATTLGADRAALLADSLYAANRSGMERDYARWAGEMPCTPPQEAHAALLHHIRHRQAHLFRQLADHTGRPTGTLAVQVEPAGAGWVQVEGLELTDARRSMEVFVGVPLRVTAIPKPGMVLAGWKGMDDDDGTIVPTAARTMRLTAVFRPAGLSQGGLQQRLEQQPAVGVAQ